MTSHSPSPAETLPGTLRLRTAGTCDLDVGHLLDVFDRQRQRFAAVLRGFEPADWAAPTRCSDWSAHQVVRHLCDCNVIAADIGPDDRTFDLAAGYDPRTTPRGWLTTSADEPPEATLSRLVTTSDELFSLLRDRLAQGRRFDVCLPFGPMDWTVLVLHIFWDSWLHERDVLLPGGTGHPTDAGATGYAAAYGLFIAAAVASLFGNPVQHELILGGDGGGVFDLDSHGGVVTLTVTPMRAEGPPAAQVADALAGRGPIPVVLAGLPASTRASLSLLADFSNTPVELAPAPKPPG